MKMFAIIVILCLGLCCNIAAVTTYHKFEMPVNINSHNAAPLHIDVLREQFWQMEANLWQYLNRTNKPITTVQQQTDYILEEYRKYLQDNRELSVILEEGKYAFLNHYEWSLLEKQLLGLERSFDGFYQFITSDLENDVRPAGEQSNSVLQYALLFMDILEDIKRTIQNIDLIMVKQTMYYRALMASKELHCLNMQSTQQFLYSLYTDIALTELKGYAMIEFSWMILRLYGKGNFTEESSLMRRDYAKRTQMTVNLLREVMRRADRIIWRCDPKKFVLGENYEEVTRLLQGYIENEVDMNANQQCWQTCDDYSRSKNEGCFKNKFCARQEACTNRIYNCDYVASDMEICPSARSSVRRYEYIKYENGAVLGREGTCNRGVTKVDSWWRYLFWHCSYCFCYCDDAFSEKTSRYFNLRETRSNIAENKVVTGLRFAKRNRIFHIQIQEGVLLPRGVINQTTLSWIPIDNYTLHTRGVAKDRDYHALGYGVTSIDLDDVITEDNAFVVTGVRFRVVGTHLNLEAHLSEFDFETGQLTQSEMNSFWKSNDNTDLSGDKREKIPLDDPDVPIRSRAKSIPDSRHNQYIDFTPSSKSKDAAQSTVPFIDIQDVTSIPPVPLSGIGLYHKGRPGFGGFLAPKLLTYDFTPHIRVPRNIT